MKRKKDRRDASPEDNDQAEADSSSEGEESARDDDEDEHADEDGGGDEDGHGDGDDEGEDDEDASADDQATQAPAAPSDPSILEIIRDSYFIFDRRTLGFTRILLGFLLVTDLFRRAAAWDDMFSDRGVLPNFVNLFRPQAWGAFSLVNAFTTHGELCVLWAFSLIVFLCVLVGYKTRVAQVISLILVASMDGRVLLIENGGYVVYNLVLLWTSFLPMGDRFSVDAMLASMRARRESTEEELNDRRDLIPPDKQRPYLSLVGFAIMLQISAIYFFNVVHKTGPAWRNGTAVHYVLYVDRMVTPLVADVRTYLPWWLMIGLTKFVLAAEAAIPVALLSPLGRVWARRLAIVLMNALHLGFGSVFVLGPFAWALCVFSTILFSSADWELAIRTMRRPHRARVVLYDPSSGASMFVCRLLARLDRYELLTFRASPGLAQGVAVSPPNDGSSLTGALASHALASRALASRALAWADIIAALPLGPVIAWIPRLPGVRHLIDAIAGALDRRDLSRIFGLRPPSSSYLAPPTSPLRLKVRRGVFVLHELFVALMIVTACNRAIVEMWVFNRRFKAPEPDPMFTLSHKLRFLQGWFMFSPNPVMDDGTFVVDAITVDGRHIDPFTRKEPFWDLSNVKSLRLTQIWCDYFNRMQKSENSAFREPMKEYLLRLPERTGNPNDTIVSAEVWWVKDMNPKWGERKSYGYDKQKMFEFTNPKALPKGASPPASPPAPRPFWNQGSGANTGPNSGG